MNGMLYLKKTMILEMMLTHKHLSKKETRLLDLFGRITTMCSEEKTVVDILFKVNDYKQEAIARHVGFLVRLGFLELIKPPLRAESYLYKTIKLFDIIITNSKDFKNYIELGKPIKVPKEPKVKKEIIVVPLPLGARIIEFNSTSKESKRLQKLLEERDRLTRSDNQVKHKKNKHRPSSGFALIPYQISQ